MLRPKTFKDLIGQKKPLKRLEISIRAAIKRGGSLPHVLVNGPPGVGKTSISYVIANELNVPIQIANGGNVRSIQQILPYIARIKHKSILFIDEIHRISPIVTEWLYPILEDFRVDLSQKDCQSFDIPKFTIIGATTDFGLLLKPLRDRFPIKLTLQLYTVEELTQIINNAAAKLKVTLTEGAARLISNTSRGTPRIALARLQFMRDFSSAQNSFTITEDLVRKALALEEIEENGLTKLDKQYLQVLRESNIPLSLKSLVAMTEIDSGTIENVVEPFLLKNKLIMKTAKGRVAC